MKLGAPNTYATRRDPTLLEFLPRKRLDTLGALAASVVGVDVWNAYEFSWLDTRGSPEQAVLQMSVDATSSCIVESKSLKLYLGGFAFERFSSGDEALRVIKGDLALGLKSTPELLLIPVGDKRLLPNPKIGYCVDSHSLREPTYEYSPLLLRVGTEERSEVIFTDTFRSVCPVTGQPDWASLYVLYDGVEIIPESFFAYVTSLRGHPGFHEECVEVVFKDIAERCTPRELSVMGCFTRRGGIDINPVRSFGGSPPLRFQRTLRQ